MQTGDALAGWWVLDYKSATQPQRQQALVAQLQRYREAVAALMPGEAVHAAFLTGDGRLVPVDGAVPPGLGHTPAPGALAQGAQPVPASSVADTAPPRQGSLF